jgi:Tfp pilus assembly protein PilX
MRPTRPARSLESGATLVVALIMIALITLLVVNAFGLSSSNLKAVGNMQARDEAVAAANRAVEVVVSSAFTDSPVAQQINVDINADGSNDYTVNVAIPRCVRARQLPATQKCDEELKALCTDADWYTDWELEATVDDPASGAQVVVNQGVRARLTPTQKAAVCATPTT